jgi:hypothetical protein
LVFHQREYRRALAPLKDSILGFQNYYEETIKLLEWKYTREDKIASCLRQIRNTPTNVGRCAQIESITTLMNLCIRR